MALETTVWKITDSLEEDPENIFFYLEAVLDENDPIYEVRAIQNVLEVRGGAENLARETGVPAKLLLTAAEGPAVDRETFRKVMEAFRPREDEASKVA